MIPPGLQFIAQASVERALNALPEGLLVALFAWLLLRLAGRQNSRTRFVVWFSALLAVVGISFFGGSRLGSIQTLLPTNRFSQHLVVSAIWADFIFAAWALFASLALARVAVGLRQVWSIRRSCRELAPSQLDPALAETFLKHSAGRPVRLGVSERVKVPAAIGFFKPIIVLPPWTLSELKPAALEPVLIHELTHLNRRDDWTNLLQKMARAIFFFHPAVWWIDARLSIEREMACDDAVLESCRNPHAYAGCLLDLLEKSCGRRGWTMAQAAVHRAQDLSRRIAQILDAGRPSTTRVWKPALALTAVLSLSCFGLSCLTPQLVAFSPNNPLAKASTPPDLTGSDLTGIQGMVVPTSYHLPPRVSPVMIKRHNPSNPSTTKLAIKSARRRAEPRALMAKATQLQAPGQGIPVQMVIFVETTTVRYQQPDGSKTQLTTAARWNTQVWQILLVAPAKNAAQMDGLRSTI